jgi:hypothetical protein
MFFQEVEVPIAYSLVTLAEQDTSPSGYPIGQFTCYWAAFNNIYVTIAERAGRHPKLKTKPDGSIKMRTNGAIQVPDVQTVSEREQIILAFNTFTLALKRGLVEHPNTSFFVYRTPRWHGQAIPIDGTGQRLNGVMNVGHTVSAEYPVWDPIDVALFEEYRKDSAIDPTQIAKQILFVLYTIRNNTFHGGKRADDAYDVEVLKMAVPLLFMIVDSFVSLQRAA